MRFQFFTILSESYNDSSSSIPAPGTDGLRQQSLPLRAETGALSVARLSLPSLTRTGSFVYIVRSS